MKSRPIIFFCVVLAVLIALTAVCRVQAQTYVNQYLAQVDSDGSVEWTITQLTSINSTIDSWDQFQQKVLSLTSQAANQTGREMAVDPNSFEMNITNHQDSQSKETNYSFKWLNFSVVQDGRMTLGDVFQLESFFDGLYGEGSLQMIYPSSFTVSSVSPAPNQRDEAAHSLEWFGTQFFIISNPSITLISIQESGSPTASPVPPNPVNDGLGLAVIAGLVVAVVVVVSLVGFYLIRRRGNRSEISKTPKLPEMPIIESEEQKIVKLLQSNGGSAYQSALTDQTRFSKAKTSQLLSELEKRGVVTRYKKGRDKIVTLAEKNKKERS